jgi:hypothetical protein
MEITLAEFEIAAAPLCHGNPRLLRGLHLGLNGLKRTNQMGMVFIK